MVSFFNETIQKYAKPEWFKQTGAQNTNTEGL